MIFAAEHRFPVAVRLASPPKDSERGLTKIDQLARRKLRR
jgi:hypothetical protein